MEANTQNRKEVQEWILNYAAYDALEKQDVEDFVELHPEWEAIFRAAERWEHLFAAARNLSDPAKDVELLPYVVATKNGHWPKKSRALQEFVSRIIWRTEKNSDLAAHRSELEQRKEEIESDTNVFDHFGAVTGINLQSPHVAPTKDKVRNIRVSTRNIIQNGQLAGAKFARAMALAAAMYLVLFTASTVRQSPVERMAHLNSGDYSWTELGVTSRGSIEWERAMVSRYNEALHLAKSSSQSFLGLFPTYDMTKMRSARDILIAAIASQSQREVVPAAAYRTLAKIHFLLGEQVESLDALRRALISDESRAQMR